MKSPYASHQCQKCGAPIGWLGRFFEFWFGTMHTHLPTPELRINADSPNQNQSDPPMTTPAKKKPVKRKRFIVLCHAGDDKSYFCTLNNDYDPKGVVLPNRSITTYEEGATIFKTHDGAEGAVAQQSAFPEWAKFKPLYEATQLEVVDVIVEEDPDALKEDEP